MKSLVGMKEDEMVSYLRPALSACATNYAVAWYGGSISGQSVAGYRSLKSHQRTGPTSAGLDNCGVM